MFASGAAFESSVIQVLLVLQFIVAKIKSRSLIVDKIDFYYLCPFKGILNFIS